MLALALLPASYFGVTAALDHANGTAMAGPAAACGSVACGSIATSPGAASTRVATSASPAVRTPAPRHVPARRASAAHPSATASHRSQGQGVPPASPPGTSARPSPQASQPRPGRTSTPRPAPPQRPRAAVSYQPEHRWPGGFTGRFTIVNEGRQPIGSWQLSVTLPGDDVRDVQGADWYTSGDSLVMEPPRDSGPLEPGSALTISIVAYGNDDTPASCSMNGRTCQR
ncbi:MAG TPA: cellulose binding domain-containing protein [Streptosporangiaceae bacterium]